MTTPTQLQSRRARVPAEFAAMQDYFWEQGWTDGLPVVPPTEDAVREMLSAVNADPSHSLGVMQPRNSRATLEKLAINAVMAGCKPEHFPVVVAAVKAALHEGYNLAGTAATTGGANQVMIVNGPVAPKLGIQADAGCFGPGFRANAAIGRALRLIVRNVAGLTPGEMDKATLSSPGGTASASLRTRPAVPGSRCTWRKATPRRAARSPWPVSWASTASWRAPPAPASASSAPSLAI